MVNHVSTGSWVNKIAPFPLLINIGQPWGLPRWLRGNKSAYQCRRHRRHGFSSWVGKIPWRRKWQPTLVFLPEKFHGQRILVGCRPWAFEELTHSKRPLMLWKIEGRRKRGWQRMRWLDSITDLWTWVLVNSSSWWWTGMPGVLWSMGSQRVGHDWATELNWNEPQAIVERFASQRTPLPLFEWKKSIISSSLPMQRAQLQRKQEVFHKVLLPFLLFLYHKMILKFLINSDVKI